MAEKKDGLLTPFIFSIFILLVFSCQQEKEQKPGSATSKLSAANGYIMGRENVGIPRAIPSGKPFITKVSDPSITSTNTPIHRAGKPELIEAGAPQICTPGSNTFPLPATVPVIDSPFVARIPGVVTAKDAFTKDHNPQSFSFFTKLQGLKHDAVDYIFQDRKGNLWLATYGGGATRYDGRYFTHYTEEEGLSSNNVLSMLEDKKGNIWFGTSNGGLSRYDGKYFTHFQGKDGLGNNNVLCMLEDKKGYLWFGTNGGVSRYDGKSFTRFTEKEGLINNNVAALMEDNYGHIWFATGGGVSKYNGRSFVNYTQQQGLASNNVLSLMEDRYGKLWFGTDHGVDIYDPAGNVFLHFSEKEGLIDRTVLSMCEDHYGNVWFGTYLGACKYDGNRVDAIARGEKIPAGEQYDLTRENGIPVRTFTHFNENSGLCNNSVLSILEDRNGNLWLGTNGGLSKYDGKSFTHFTEKEGLNDHTVLSIVEDKNGSLWFSNYGGTNKYDGTSFRFFSYGQGLKNTNVLAALEDRYGNLWFGTTEGVSKYDGEKFVHFTEKEGLANRNVWCLAEDKSGNLWFGTDSGVIKYDGNRVDAIERGEPVPLKDRQDLLETAGKPVASFTHFTATGGLSNNSVRCILEDRKGDLWFGTHGGGAIRYTPSSIPGTGTFTHFTKKEGMLNNSVRCILEDRKGTLWFGTNGGGVTHYDPEFNRGAGSFMHYTEQEGLSNNIVLSMLEDKNGNLWLGTRFGLSRLSHKMRSGRDEENVFFKNYTYEDGFLGMGVNRGKTICEDRNGTIWIGANDRLTAFHPSGDDPDTIAPNIQVRAIDLFNETMNWFDLEHKKDSSILLGNGVRVGNFEFEGTSNWYGLPEKLSLAFNNNYLTFHFIGITQKQSKKVKYQYMLEGMDDHWSALTSRTEAPYGNLPHGSYTFKVKAMNSEGYWSNEFNYSFTIRPPWWKTWWFRTITAALIAVSGWYYIKNREKKLLADKKRLERTVAERTAEVVEKQKEIVDSINYAQRIQRAKLPEKEEIYASLARCFVLFKPKDIVSGDFYFYQKRHHTVFIAAADCTGHGVPGALMSMIGSEQLNQAVSQSNSPSEILQLLNRGIKISLRQSDSLESTRDGMDIALCAIDTQSRIVQYAGANRPFWMIRKGEAEVEEIKATKKAIGGLTGDDQHFDTHEIKLNEGDSFYLTTDGYGDTFSGKDDKKLTTKKFKQLLLEIQDQSMPAQEECLERFIEDWKAGTEQVDDILVIGIRL